MGRVTCVDGGEDYVSEGGDTRGPWVASIQFAAGKEDLSEVNTGLN